MVLYGISLDHYKERALSFTSFDPLRLPKASRMLVQPSQFLH